MARSKGAAIRAANVKLIENGELDAISEYFAVDYFVHVTGEDLPGGHQLVKKIVRAYRRAFQGIRADVEILVTTKQRVAWQRTLNATHQGPFQGFPATGQAIVWRDMIVTEFRDGLIAEEWVVTDLAEKLLLARKR